MLHRFRFAQIVITACAAVVALPTPTQAAALLASNSVVLTSEAMVERSETDAAGKEKLVLKKPSDVIVVPGDRIIFTLRYVNNGAEPASGFRATNPMPAPVQFVSVAEDWAEVSVDGGKSWSATQTINDNQQPISHRFLALDWGGNGLSAVWLDARDKVAAKAQKRDYRGSALYSARFDVATGRFGTNLKLADHSCECCRVALSHDPDGVPVALWRHVFEGNIRDHALQRLDGKSPLQQVSFEAWQIEACPHHGPSLAIDNDGTRHLTWFNQNSGPHLLFYGRMPAKADKPENVLGFGNPEQQASHPVVSSVGQRVALAWKEYDGQQSLIRVMISRNGGQNWNAPITVLTSGHEADYPQLLRWQGRIFLLWNIPEQGSSVVELGSEGN